jgi:predicted  nucleic acid-binding Zn-ribbon protein
LYLTSVSFLSEEFYSMPTVHETLTALYALQQIDTQTQRTKKAQSALDNGTTAAAALEVVRGLAAQRRSVYQKLAGELKDSELKLETVETKRKNYQHKLYQGTVTNPKELGNIEKEIDVLGRQQSDLDGRILELMETVEQEHAALTLAEDQAKQAESHHHQIVATHRSRYDALELELTALRAQRSQALAQVEDKALLKRYEDLRTKLGGVGIGKIDGSTCGGCHMTLSSTAIKAVKEEAQVQTCENCGRLL